MTSYEQLKSVIQAANPEIMELKFGCEVYLSVGQNIHRNGLAKAVILYTTENFVHTCSDTFGYYKTEHEIIKSVLGRHIRLADVLLALGKKYDSKTYTVDLAGGFQKIGTGWLLCQWDLADDNLDHQSNEMKRCLIELLTSQQ
jgi:hypothetical protein